MQVKEFTAGTIKVKVYESEQAAGEAAAQATAEELTRLAKEHDVVGVIFATGASQLKTLQPLTAMQDLPWGKVSGFHLDEYLGIDENHPASFRRYLREHLTERVHLGEFLAIDGSTPDPARLCRDYAARVEKANPLLCLLGVGENGHLAFNDPAEADFQDPQAMKVVELDQECRQQQLSEGWFPTFEDVPTRALTLTIPTILKVPKLIASVPGPRKAESVRRTLFDPISAACPATILRTHPDVTLYLDRASAAKVNGFAG